MMNLYLNRECRDEAMDFRARYPNSVFSEYVSRKLAEAASGQESDDAGGRS